MSRKVWYADLPTCDHPPYEELDYTCWSCGYVLTSDDDYRNN